MTSPSADTVLQRCGRWMPDDEINIDLRLHLKIQRSNVSSGWVNISMLYFMYVNSTNTIFQNIFTCALLFEMVHLRLMIDCFRLCPTRVKYKLVGKGVNSIKYTVFQFEPGSDRQITDHYGVQDRGAKKLAHRTRAKDVSANCSCKLYICPYFSTL